jgi:hypothetical protein
LRGEDLVVDGRVRLRATDAGRLGEVELAVIQLAHARQALAERVQARRLGLQLTQLDCQRIEVALAARLGLVQLGLLCDQLLAQRFHIAGAQAFHLAESPPREEPGAHHRGQQQHRRARQPGARARAAEVETARASARTANQYDVHDSYPSSPSPVR